jgi:hypothetical protein
MPQAGGLALGVRSKERRKSAIAQPPRRFMLMKALAKRRFSHEHEHTENQTLVST